jgi:hypothetical protein
MLNYEFLIEERALRAPQFNIQHSAFKISFLAIYGLSATRCFEPGLQ